MLVIGRDHGEIGLHNSGKWTLGLDGNKRMMVGEAKGVMVEIGNGDDGHSKALKGGLTQLTIRGPC